MNEDEKKERDERRIANAMAFIAKHPPRTRAEIKAEEAEERRLWFEEYIRKNPPPTFESLQKRCKPVWVLVVQSATSLPKRFGQAKRKQFGCRCGVKME